MGDRGFTLIEIMITVVIVGILTTIAFSQYSQYIMRSQAFEVYSAELIVKKEMEFAAQSNNSRYISNIPTPNSFNMLHFISSFECQTDGQDYICTLSADKNKGVNPNLIGSKYVFDSSGNRSTVSTGNTSWPTSNNCYVVSSGGC